MATIKLKRSSTTGSVGPSTAGEISTNITDKKIFVGAGGSSVITYVDETQVDTKITTALSSLSSAFEYKGSVAGNAQASTDTAVSATELADGPSTGDYYRISTAGFVKAKSALDATAFFVNLGDAVVYNGASWDVIDNTNSGITADSGADLSVTGSSDAGFVIGFSSTAALDQATQTVDGGSY